MSPLNEEMIEELLIKRPDRLQLCKFADLLKRPPAPWQIKGVFREQSVSLLYGRRGCYKSFVALDFAASLATGTPWQGHEIVTPGLVIYVAAEGGGGMVQRARAWVAEHKINPRDVNLLFVTEPVVVTASSEDMDILIHRIQSAIGYTPAGHFDTETGWEFDEPLAREWPCMIVIDTLARCLHGNENQPDDMGQFVQGIDRLKMEFNCSVLILHHTGRDESRERGHTSLPAACDTMYRLDAFPKKNELLLTCEKMKDSGEPGPRKMSYEVVTVERREFDDPDEDLTSVVIRALGPEAKPIDAMLDILVVAGSLTWEEWRVLCDEIGIPRTSFSRYLVGLTKDGKIIKKNGQYEAV